MILGVFSGGRVRRHMNVIGKKASSCHRFTLSSMIPLSYPSSGDRDALRDGIHRRLGRFLRAFAVTGLAGLVAAHAQVTPLTNVQMSGSLNTIANSAELTIKAGATLTAESGSVVDLFHATVALPDSLSLTELTLNGLNNVADGA